MLKMKLLNVPLALAVMSALVITADTSTSRRREWPTTPGTSGLNLKGKMFTLSGNGGISFYPPYYFPKPTGGTTTFRPWRTTTTRRWTTTTSRPWRTTTTRRWTTTTSRPWRTTTTRPRTTTTSPPWRTTTTTRPWYTTTSPWTSAPPTRGVSVCVRYLTDSSYSLFTLSPSDRNALQLSTNRDGTYVLNFRYSSSLYLRPNLWFWPKVGQDIWTRVCLTVDTMKNVAQLFSGSNISIRKMLPTQYVWSGEPVISFSDFSGQVTDVQIWDYPLSYREVFYYMTNGVYGSKRGSVLTWFDISYSLRGRALLEDSYEWQARQPINSSQGKNERHLKGRNKSRKSFNVERALL